jgi:hypothetical protein
MVVRAIRTNQPYLFSPQESPGEARARFARITGDA